MARKLMPGNKVRGYTIKEFINSGMMALSYAAIAPSGAKVFFKQYKSPSITVPWYRDYIQYQGDIKKRIESGIAKQMTVRFIDLFESAEVGSNTYYQVFEFVEGGKNLADILDQIRAKPSSFAWEQRLIFAKVMMGSIKAIHEAGVIHCDLKPHNLQLFEDKTITAKYRLKLIDMDFSILADTKAPWHNHQGYIGTAGYLSPEHFTPKSTPLLTSDIFTCGLILYELLSKDGHPYLFDEEDQYRKAALAHKAAPPKLLGSVREGISNDEAIGVIHRCLSPEAAKRPAAKDVLDALNGILKTLPVRPPVPSPSPPKPALVMPEKTKPVAPVSPGSHTVPAKQGRLELRPEKGNPISIGIRTDIGKNLCKGFGPDAQFMDTLQFTLERGSEGTWLLTPNTGAANETMVNGKAVKGPVPVKNGDVVGVGRESKGIVKMPLTVTIR